MINIYKYTSDKQDEWNHFLCSSKNGVFLFNRGYMEYHRHLFVDFSLMIYEGENLVALLPANIESDQLVSHAGLTFGGVVTDARMSVSLMLKVLDEIINYARGRNLKKVIYKRIPYIYHSSPSEEDLYALFIRNAKLIRRDASSTIYLKNLLPFRKNRTRAIKKAEASQIKVRESEDFFSFWKILSSNLATKYNKKPVHSLQEITYLHQIFPKNIRLFASYLNGSMLAGVVVYESANVAHAQYIAKDPDNMVPGSLDILFYNLIKKYSSSISYFDFGISTEKEGLHLNENLISFKEGFGARAIAYDFYGIDIHG